MRSIKKKKIKKILCSIFGITVSVMLFGLTLFSNVRIANANTTNTDYNLKNVFNNSYFSSYYENTLFPLSNFDVSFNSYYQYPLFDLQFGGYSMSNFIDNSIYYYQSNDYYYTVKISNDSNSMVAYTDLALDSIIYSFDNIVIPFKYNDTLSKAELFRTNFVELFNYISFVFSPSSLNFSFDVSFTYTENSDFRNEYSDLITKHFEVLGNNYIGTGGYFGNLLSSNNVIEYLYNNYDVDIPIYSLADYTTSSNLLSVYDSFYTINNVTFTFNFPSYTIVYLKSNLPTNSYERYFFNSTFYNFIYTASLTNNSSLLYNEGYNVGFVEGQRYQASQLTPFEIIVKGVESFFNIEIFPNFRLSYILMIGVGVSVIGIGLKFFLGG